MPRSRCYTRARLAARARTCADHNAFCLRLSDGLNNSLAHRSAALRAPADYAPHTYHFSAQAFGLRTRTRRATTYLNVRA